MAGGSGMCGLGDSLVCMLPALVWCFVGAPLEPLTMNASHRAVEITANHLICCEACGGADVKTLAIGNVLGLSERTQPCAARANKQLVAPCRRERLESNTCKVVESDVPGMLAR